MDLGCKLGFHEWSIWRGCRNCNHMERYCFLCDKLQVKRKLTVQELRDKTAKIKLPEAFR